MTIGVLLIASNGVKIVLNAMPIGVIPVRSSALTALTISRIEVVIGALCAPIAMLSTVMNVTSTLRVVASHVIQVELSTITHTDLTLSSTVPIRMNAYSLALR
jgi:hypothetical protein